MSLPPRWFLQYLCDVLEVDLGQAERLAYGEEVLYLPEGLYPEDVVYQLEDIRDSLSGGASYGILKLLLMALTIRSFLAFNVTTDCPIIKHKTPEETKFFLNGELQKFERLQIGYRKDDPEFQKKLGQDIAKVNLQIFQNNQCLGIAPTATIAPIKQEAENVAALADAATNAYISYNWLAYVVAAFGLTVTGALWLCINTLNSSRINPKLEAESMIAKDLASAAAANARAAAANAEKEAAEAQYNLLQLQSFSPASGRRASPSPASRRRVSPSPRKYPSSSNRSASKKRSARGGFFKGGFEDLIAKINATIQNQSLSGGDECSSLGVFATLMTIIIVFLFITVYVQNNEFLKENLDLIFIDMETQYNILMETMFGKGIVTGWTARILRETGHYINAVLILFKSAFANMGKLTFSKFVQDMFNNATKIPQYWATSLFPFIRSVLGTFLEVVGKVAFGAVSAVWNASTVICASLLTNKGKESVVKPEILVDKEKVVTEVIRELAGVKEIDVKPLDKKINSTVKKLRVKKVKMVGSPKRKRPSPKKTLT